jgi:hypothetical protein
MTDLRELLAEPGPFATVALASPSAVSDASDQLDIRWRNARRRLADAGFPAGGLDRLDETAHSLRHEAGAALVLIHSPGHEVFVEYLDDAIERDLAVVDALPRLGLVLESRQRSIPHLVVVTDRTGADVVGVGAPTGDTTVEVEGETLHVHRGHPGGWSQRRFQQRAENRWESNAALVADEVAQMARQIDARVVLVAGDVRAVGFLFEHLPKDVASITRELDGQSVAAVADETVRLVADVVARDTKSLLDRFHEAAGQSRASEGADETLDALSQGRVETLLVHDDPSDARRAEFDPDGLWCSANPNRRPRPAGDVVDGRLVDVAIRAALCSDGTVRHVPKHGGPAEGLGALLRW